MLLYKYILNKCLWLHFSTLHTVPFFGSMFLPSTLHPSSQYNKGKESEKKGVRIKLT